MSNSNGPGKSDLEFDTSPEMVEHLLEEAGKAMEAKAKEPGPVNKESTTIKDLRRSIKSGAVLFYPACFLDWSIIKDLSGQCRTFIYSDWHTTVPQMEQAMRQVPIQNPALNALRCDWNGAVDIPPHRLVPRPLLAQPTFLTPGERECYRGNFNGFANQQPWCRWVPTIHAVEGQDRKLDLVYLTVEGVNTYWKLFNRHRTAPKYFCIKKCGDGFGFNYTNFNDWDQPLGRAVLEGWRKHGHAPEFLITDRKGHNWPWTEVVGRITGATIYRRSKGLTPQQAGGARRKLSTRNPKRRTGRKQRPPSRKRRGRSK